MPVDEALERFGSYRKIIMVRHPLQRFMSGYYEEAVSGKHGIGKRIQNLTDFVTKFVVKKGGNFHWPESQTVVPPLSHGI